MFSVSFTKYLFCANNKHTTFSKITFNFYKAVPQVEARDFKNCYSKLFITSEGILSFPLTDLKLNFLKAENYKHKSNDRLFTILT